MQRFIPTFVGVETLAVTLLRWPEESALRETLRSTRRARLLLVPEDHDPPVAEDCLEDWIRAPAPETDVRARIEALSARSSRHDVYGPGQGVPELDGHGVLRYGGHWVALPPLESRIAGVMLSRFGAVASREALLRAGWPTEPPGRNALDVHVLRLRRRLTPLNLVIRTVRSRGYLLEAGRESNGEADHGETAGSPHAPF